MRFLVWTCRVVLTIAIAAFVATVFYLTHTVDMPEAARAALNWTTVVATALVGLTWPLMRRYGQGLLLLIGLVTARVLWGTDPGLSSLNTPLLTPFQSDFLWVPIGVALGSLLIAIVTRAIVSDRRMRAMKQQSSTVVTTADVKAETAAALQEPAALVEPEPKAPEVTEVTEKMPAPAEVETPASEEPPAAEETGKKK